MLTCRWGDKGETGEIGDALSVVRVQRVARSAYVKTLAWAPGVLNLPPFSCVIVVVMLVPKSCMYPSFPSVESTLHRPGTLLVSFCFGPPHLRIGNSFWG